MNLSCACKSRGILERSEHNLHGALRRCFIVKFVSRFLFSFILFLWTRFRAVQLFGKKGEKFVHTFFVRTTFLDIDLSRFVLQIFGARQHEPYLSCRFLFKVSIYPFVLFQFSLSFYLSSINRFNFYSRSILIKVIAGGRMFDIR